MSLNEITNFRNEIYLQKQIFLNRHKFKEKDMTSAIIGDDWKINTGAAVFGGKIDNYFSIFK